MRRAAVIAACMLVASVAVAQVMVGGRSQTLRRMSYESMPESIEASCVLWQAFEYDDGGAVYYDYATPGNDGSQTNSAARPTWGGGAYAFATNDFIMIDRRITNDLNGASAITCSTWVKSVPTANAQIITLPVSTAFTGFVLDLAADGTSLRFRGRSDTSDVLQAVQIVGVPTNTWVHVAAVSDYAGDVLTIYTNGALATNHAVSYASASFTLALPITSQYAIGSNLTAPNGGNFWNGWLDDVRLYNRVLTATEVGSIWLMTKDVVRP